MPRRFEGSESKPSSAYAAQNPAENKAATMPRYSDVAVAMPRNVRGIYQSAASAEITV